MSRLTDDEARAAYGAYLSGVPVRELKQRYGYKGEDSLRERWVHLGLWRRDKGRVLQRSNTAEGGPYGLLIRHWMRREE